MADLYVAPPWPPTLDRDAEVFGAQLTALYGSDHGTHAAGPVDVLGWVRWGSDYRLHRANGLSHDQAWARIEAAILEIWGAVSQPPPPPPSAVRRLSIDGTRWFATDQGRFDYRELTAFPLLALWITGRRDEAVRVIDQALAERFSVFRVLVTLDNEFWTTYALRFTGRSLRCAPDMPGYDDGLLDLVRYLAGRGAYIRVVLLGALEPFGGAWDPATRRDIWRGTVRERGEQHCLHVAALLKDEPNVLLEIANEPDQIGLRDSAEALAALGHRIKAVAPGLLLNGGAVDGAGDQDPKYAVRPFDFVDAHIDRRMGVKGFEWVKRSGEYTLIDQPQTWPDGHPLAGQPTGIARMPFVSGEPVNFGDWRKDGRNGDVARDPVIAFAYGACSRARQYNACFHFDDGLWGLPMAPLTLQHARAFHAALDAFPMLTAGKWRGHWAPEQGNYWNRDQWPDSDGAAEIEAHVRSGRGPWRVFGCGDYSMTIAEPRDWDFRRGLQRGVTVERVAFCDGPYHSGVYVRRK